MSYSNYGHHTSIVFTLPFWVMGDEFTRSPKPGEHSDGNVIEDELMALPQVESVCLNHQCWVEIVLDCTPHQLHHEIEMFHQKLETILKRWNKQRKGKRT